MATAELLSEANRDRVLEQARDLAARAAGLVQAIEAMPPAQSS